MAKRRQMAKGKTFMLRRLMLIGIVLGAAAAAVLAIVLIKQKNSAFISARAMPFSAADKFHFTGGGFLYTEGSTLKYADLTDHDKDFTASLPAGEISLAGKGGLTAVYSKTALQIIGADFAVEFSGQVLEVRCGEAYVAVLREDASGKKSLMVYNKAAVQVDQIDFTDTAYPVDFGFYNAPDEVLFVTTMSASASLPITTITTYNMSKGATTGIMSVRRELVEGLRFSANSVFVVGTTDLIRYSHVDNHEGWRLLIYGWKLYDYTSSGTKPMFLMTPRDQASLGTVRLYTVSETDDIASETVATVQLPANVLQTFLAKGRMYAITADTLYTYTASGKVGQSMRLPFVISGATKLSDTQLLLRGEDGLYLATLK